MWYRPLPGGTALCRIRPWGGGESLGEKQRIAVPRQEVQGKDAGKKRKRNRATKSDAEHESTKKSVAQSNA